MNMVLLKQNDFIENDEVSLKGRRFTHIKKILRTDEGDMLNCGLVNGKTGKGVITYIGGSEVRIKVELTEDPPVIPKITLVLALPRPIVVKRILKNVSSMGIKKMIFINSARVEKSFWQSPVLKNENIEEQLILGLEQAKDTILPVIEKERLFKPFVEDKLPGLIRGKQSYLAHPGSGQLNIRRHTKPVFLIIGPEGGFVPYEVELFKNSGLKVFSLGERVLNVETAVTFAISKFL